MEFLQNITALNSFVYLLQNQLERRCLGSHTTDVFKFLLEKVQIII